MLNVFRTIANLSNWPHFLHYICIAHSIPHSTSTPTPTKCKLKTKKNRNFVLFNDHINTTKRILLPFKRATTITKESRRWENAIFSHGIVCVVYANNNVSNSERHTCRQSRRVGERKKRIEKKTKIKNTEKKVRVHTKLF